MTAGPPPFPPGWGRAAVRRIPLLRLDGRWQMAIDEWLLDQAVAGAGPAFRLYRWSRPTLSLGFHQRRVDPRWSRLAASGEIDLVRRPTGGRAVLHAGDLTYALIWPEAPGRRMEAYQQACVWLLEAFRAAGLPLVFGTAAAGEAAGNCFASATAADLIHAGGAKRIGSAQLRRQGCLLQHGSIQLAPPPELWRAVFGQDPPSLPPLAVDPEPLLSRSAEAHLRLGRGQEGQAGLRWREQPLRPGEIRAIRQRLGRYGVVAEGDPGGSDTSPERSMAWAT